MSAQQTFSTGDLRSGAQEFRRDKTHRVKWAHGQEFGPGRRVAENRPRPGRPSRRGPNKAAVPVPTLKSHHDFFNKAHTALKKDINSASDESSADEDVEAPSTAPDPEAGFAYSYDVERSPTHGSQILNLALAKAVERFEVQQTDKLIKEEYEVLDPSTDLPSPAPKARKLIAVEDADYEFIEV